METRFGEEEQKLYSWLFVSEMDLASASFDLELLIKKGWHLPPQKRRGRNSEQHQAAYVSALLVAYGRPFIAGLHGPAFPQELIPFTPQECDLHERLLEMRHHIVAHSNGTLYFMGMRRVQDFLQNIARMQYPFISPADGILLRGMIWKLRKAIHGKLEEMLLQE
jgi:hypothetical protein